MKHTRNIFLGSFLVVAALMAGSGCVGYADEGGGAVVYGPDVWVSGGGWIDGGGRGWYGRHDGGYAHPDRGHAAPARADGHGDRDHH
jgi:hypothetical protein